MIESDISRKWRKRKEALETLEEFKNWHEITDQFGHTSTGNQVLVMGLTRDILLADESELDRLAKEMTQRNSAAMIKKMAYDG